MSATTSTENGTLRQWVVGQIEPSGHFTAQVAGIPELRATATTRAEAISSVRAMFSEWIASGRLTAIELPRPNPLLHFHNHLDPADPLEREFLAELTRRRQEDRDQALREDNPECPDSSSTPIT